MIMYSKEGGQLNCEFLYLLANRLHLANISGIL